MPRYRQRACCHCGNSSARAATKEARQHHKTLLKVTVAKLLEVKGEVYGAAITD